MTPGVSIVMATRNYGRFLGESIGSVLAQTFTDWELIVVNDGSTDDTVPRLERFRDSRIRTFHADRLGQSRAKNLGVALGRGELIAFLDADDAWEPTKLAKQLPLFSGTVGVVYSGRSLMDEHSRPIADQIVSPLPGRGDIRDRLFIRNGICFSSAIVRRSLFERVGRFDESLDLAVDYDLWLRAARVARFDFIDEPLVRYRTGHANLSRNLDDRVAIACSVMARAAIRGGYRGRTVAEGYADTCRTLAYELRTARPADSLAWSWRALSWPHRRIKTLKGMLGTLIARLRLRPAVG